MAYIDPNKCLMCGNCASACPVGAIHESDESYRVSNSACVHCGFCVSVCSAHAISN